MSELTVMREFPPVCQSCFGPLAVPRDARLVPGIGVWLSDAPDRVKRVHAADCAER